MQPARDAQKSPCPWFRSVLEISVAQWAHVARKDYFCNSKSKKVSGHYGQAVGSESGKEKS